MFRVVQGFLTEMKVGIGMGNPGVKKGYPYPNPEIPLPSIPGRGILGLG